jgi:hypothetical protein
MAEVINEPATNAADLALAPTEMLSQFRCAGCGYGARCRIVPQRCPMCNSTAWEPETRGWSSDLDQPLRRDQSREDRVFAPLHHRPQEEIDGRLQQPACQEP